MNLFQIVFFVVGPIVGLLAFVWFWMALRSAPWRRSDDNDNFYRAAGVLRGNVADREDGE